MADLVKWSPFSEIVNIRDEMNKLFAPMFSRYETGVFDNYSGWLPSVDMKVVDGNVVIEADLPGMKREDIDVSVSSDSVWITGKLQKESKSEDEKFIRCERRWGKFQRVLSLPVEVDPEKSNAKLENGVLRIEIPSVEMDKTRSVKVDIQ